MPCAIAANERPAASVARPDYARIAKEAIGTRGAAPTTPHYSPVSVVQVPAGQCVDFSPYVGTFNPNGGPHPPAAIIDELLDFVVEKTGARCIVTYGVLNGLDHVVVAAANRGLSVVLIIYLDAVPSVNAASITAGSALARQYPLTVTRVSCGSEVAVRNGLAAAASIISGCINQLRADGVPQPITSIDTWWEWCNEQSPCQVRGLSSSVDWIGVNVFPWWENKYSGLYRCTLASAAGAFNVARLQDVATRYPTMPVMLTEFGWPAGPDGYTETNQVDPSLHCGVASESNQQRVVSDTITLLNQSGLTGAVFEALREPWKATPEGVVGPFWGTVPLNVFTDDPVAAGTAIRAVHVTELRLRIDLLRARFGLAPYGWSDTTLRQRQDAIRAVHVSEMRTAVQQAYAAASLTPPSFTNPTLSSGVTVVRSVHITELRAAVLALEAH